MARHTFMLGDLVRATCREYGLQPTQANWPRCYAYLGMDGYTLTDAAHVQVLNDKLIKHFWFHEIGSDTPGQFAWFMGEALNLIMPYYDELYRCEYLKAANLIGVSTEELINGLYGETGKRDTTATSTGEATSHSSDTTNLDGSSTESVNTTDRALDTPMGAITNLDDGYLTTGARGDRATDSTVDNTSTSSGDTTSTQETSATDSESTSKDSNETRQRTSFVSDPKYAEVLLTLGRALLNIDEQVVKSKEIHECFWYEYDY